MGGLTRNQIVLMIVGVLAIIGVVIFVVVSNSGDDKDAVALPTGDPTIATQAPTEAPTESSAPVVSAPVVVPSPSAVPTVAGGLPSALSPKLKILDMGSPAALDKVAGPEERAFREKAYSVIATYTNSAGPQYKDASGAKDELLSQGMITENMAKTQFFSDWTAMQKDLNAAKFTVQTTGLFCTLRAHSAGTVFDNGVMSCFQTREVVDANGDRVSFQKYKDQIAYGMGAIDPDEQLRLTLKLAQENGVWKIDAITNG